MRISVLIPTYNSSKTIGRTLDSVLSQTLAPDEILVLDDGSTDDTVSTLHRRYSGRVKVLEQQNAGVAQARNVLAGSANGDLFAFLDHDDIWHPDYLATQKKAFIDHPNAVGLFTAHENFFGYGGYEWKNNVDSTAPPVEVISARDFLIQYHKAIGKFASMSFFCIPKRVIDRLGYKLFSPEVTGVDDYYFFHTLMLQGPVVFNPNPLVAYRITPDAQSASLLRSVQKAVRAMELLKPSFLQYGDFQLRRAFRAAFAAQRREYGRVLMGIGQADQARKHFRISMIHSGDPRSLAKSLTWLLLTVIPSRWQPVWPSEWKPLHARSHQGEIQNFLPEQGRVLHTRSMSHSPR